MKLHSLSHVLTSDYTTESLLKTIWYRHKTANEIKQIHIIVHQTQLPGLFSCYDFYRDAKSTHWRKDFSKNAGKFVLEHKRNKTGLLSLDLYKTQLQMNERPQHKS